MVRRPRMPVNRPIYFPLDLLCFRSSNYAMDKDLLLGCSRVRNLITLEQTCGRTSSPSFGIRMHRAKRFPGCDSITNFAMQNNSNRWVDRVFLFLAPAAENDARRSDRFAVHGRDIAILRTAHVLHVFRMRKFAGIVERANVSPLQGNHLAELLQRLPGSYQLLPSPFPPPHCIGSPANVKHPTRKFETQFFQVVRPASTQDFE